MGGKGSGNTSKDDPLTDEMMFKLLDLVTKQYEKGLPGEKELNRQKYYHYSLKIVPRLIDEVMRLRSGRDIKELVESAPEKELRKSSRSMDGKGTTYRVYGKPAGAKDD